MNGQPWSSRRDLPVGAALALLAPLFALRAVVFSGFTLVPGDIFDGRLCAFLLEHSWGWLAGNPLHQPLWSLPIFFPGGSNALAYSDPMVSFGPLYWPWRAVGLPPDTSYQLWTLLVVSLNVSTGFLFLRLAVGSSRLAAVPGAWLATCSASRMHQISHAQLLPFFYVLLGLGAAILWPRLERRGHRWTALGVVVAALVLQLYGGVYQGFFLALALAVLLLVTLAMPVSARVVLARMRMDWPALVVAAAVAVAALSPWLTHYLAAQQELGPRGWGVVERLVPGPTTWLFMPPEAVAYEWLRPERFFGPRSSEHAVGLGFLTTACVLAGAWSSRRRVSIALTVLAVTTLMALTTRVGGHTAWRALVEAFPPLAAVRALSRVGLLLPTAAAVVLAAWLDGVRSRRWRPVVLALFLLCGLEQLVRLDTSHREVQRFWVDEIARRVDRRARAFVVTRSSGRELATAVHVDAMWAADLTGVPTVNGASGNEPPGWEGLQRARVRNEEAATLYRGALEGWVRGGGADPATVQWIRLPPRYRGVDPALRRPRPPGRRDARQAGR